MRKSVERALECWRRIDRRRLRRVTLFAALTLAAFVLRQVLINNGIVYGTDRVRVLTIGCVAVVGLVGVVAVGVKDASAFLSVAAAITAVLAFVELLSPAGAELQAPLACRGTQVQGTAFVASTTGEGGNVRAGAGRTFPRLQRLGPECSAGFEGYCVGEPAMDYQVKPFFPDVRWLQMPGERGYVAAAILRPEQAVEDLPRLPIEVCNGDTGDPEPARVKVPGPSQAGDEVTLTATAKGAPIIGFARYDADSDTATKYQPINLVATSQENASTSWRVPEAGNGTITVAVVPCLASEVPADADVTMLSLKPGGQWTQGSELAIEDIDRLRHAACLLPPISG